MIVKARGELREATHVRFTEEQLKIHLSKAKRWVDTKNLEAFDSCVRLGAYQCELRNPASDQSRMVAAEILSNVAGCHRLHFPLFDNNILATLTDVLKLKAVKTDTKLYGYVLKTLSKLIWIKKGEDFPEKQNEIGLFFTLKANLAPIICCATYEVQTVDDVDMVKYALKVLNTLRKVAVLEVVIKVHCAHSGVLAVTSTLPMTDSSSSRRMNENVTELMSEYLALRECLLPFSEGLELDGALVSEWKTLVEKKHCFRPQTDELKCAEEKCDDCIEADDYCEERNIDVAFFTGDELRGNGKDADFFVRFRDSVVDHLDHECAAHKKQCRFYQAVGSKSAFLKAVKKRARVVFYVAHGEADSDELHCIENGESVVVGIDDIDWGRVQLLILGNCFSESVARKIFGSVKRGRFCVFAVRFHIKIGQEHLLNFTSIFWSYLVSGCKLRDAFQTAEREYIGAELCCCQRTHTCDVICTKCGGIKCCAKHHCKGSSRCPDAGTVDCGDTHMRRQVSEAFLLLGDGNFAIYPFASRRVATEPFAVIRESKIVAHNIPLEIRAESDGHCAQICKCSGVPFKDEVWDGVVKWTYHQIQKRGIFVTYADQKFGTSVALSAARYVANVHFESIYETVCFVDGTHRSDWQTRKPVADGRLHYEATYKRAYASALQSDESRRMPAGFGRRTLFVFALPGAGDFQFVQLMEDANALIRMRKGHEVVVVCGHTCPEWLKGKAFAYSLPAVAAFFAFKFVGRNPADIVEIDDKFINLMHAMAKEPQLIADCVKWMKRGYETCILQNVNGGRTLSVALGECTKAEMLTELKSVGDEYEFACELDNAWDFCYDLAIDRWEIPALVTKLRKGEALKGFDCTAMDKLFAAARVLRENPEIQLSDESLLE